MSGLAESEPVKALTAKVGPLPAWAWGLMLGGTIVGVRWYRNRSHPAPVTGTSADGAGGESGDPTEQGVGVGVGDPGIGMASPGVVGAYPIPSTYQANPGGTITSDGLPSGSEDTGPLNNGEWREQAFDQLRGKGYDPTAASTALSKYLSSQPLTPAEVQMVSFVLQMVGEPPEGAPAIVREGAQATTPTTPAPPPVSVTPPLPAPPQKWVKPPWLGSAKFVIGADGGAVYMVTDDGLVWIPSEAVLYANGGGGTVQLSSGPYTYGGNPGGAPPLAIPASTLASLPKVGPQP